MKLSLATLLALSSPAASALSAPAVLQYYDALNARVPQLLPPALHKHARALRASVKRHTARQLLQFGDPTMDPTGMDEDPCPQTPIPGCEDFTTEEGMDEIDGTCSDGQYPEEYMCLAMGGNWTHICQPALTAAEMTVMNSQMKTMCDNGCLQKHKDAFVSLQACYQSAGGFWALAAMMMTSMLPIFDNMCDSNPDAGLMCMSLIMGDQSKIVNKMLVEDTANCPFFQGLGCCFDSVSKMTSVMGGMGFEDGGVDDGVDRTQCPDAPVEFTDIPWTLVGTACSISVAPCSTIPGASPASGGSGSQFYTVSEAAPGTALSLSALAAGLVAGLW